MPPTPTDPQPRTAIAGRYTLLERIGRGGMATVHRAHDETLDRDVAIKLLHPHLTDDRRVLDRFKREAQAAANLQHHGVVAVHDWGVDGDTPFLVMELVEGRSLREVLDLRGRLRPGEALALLAPAIAGLAAAHQAGTVHRDVTPSNILLTADGASKLGDFGLARSVAATTATFAEAIVGSPHYLSPEAARGERLDARADVYSLGCVLFECVTGRPPFDGDTPVAIAARHGNEPVPLASTLAPSVPSALDALIEAATASDPEQRPADAAEFATRFLAAIPEGPEQVDLRDGSSAIVVLPEHATRSLGDLAPTTAMQPRRSGAGGKLLRALRAMVVSLLVVLLVGGGGWLAWDRVIAPVQDVPSVIGLTSSDARQLLEGLGFAVRVEDERTFHREIPEGAVAAQSTDQQARRRSTIALTLSAGPRTGQLPALVGRGVTDATAAIEELGLDLQVTVVEAFDDDASAGTVLEATPDGGSRITEGSEVTLTISAGPAPVELPDLIGSMEGAATAELVGLGLTVRVVERRFDDLPAGSVVEMTPPPGATVRRGDEIAFVISEGPEPVEVPDVVGLRESEAITVLSNASFEVDVRYVQTLLPFAAGFVDAQDPEGGVTRPKGSTIRIFVWE